jgi:hypothetical protein
VEQVGAHRHQPVEGVRVQRLEAGTVGPQRLGETVLGDEELDEEVEPPAKRGDVDPSSPSRAGPTSARASTWWR